MPQPVTYLTEYTFTFASHEFPLTSVCRIVSNCIKTSDIFVNGNENWK